MAPSLKASQLRKWSHRQEVPKENSFKTGYIGHAMWCDGPGSFIFDLRCPQCGLYYQVSLVAIVDDFKGKVRSFLRYKKTLRQFSLSHMAERKESEASTLANPWGSGQKKAMTGIQQ